MVVLPIHANDDEVLAVARAWADLVAMNDVVGAQKLLMPGWTPQAVRERLGSFGPSCPQEVSPEDLFMGDAPKVVGVPPAVVERRGDSTDGRVVLGLDFADCPRGLIAEFRLRPSGDGISLDLADLRRG